MLLFSNGGASKKKSRKAKVVKGRLSAPVDVRSRDSVPAFEKLLERDLSLSCSSMQIGAALAIVSRKILGTM